MSTREHLRIVGWGSSGDFDCRRCGKTLHLYFNGGELDSHDCCGLTYRTEHGDIDLVISEEVPSLPVDEEGV